VASSNVEALQEIYEHWSKGKWDYLPPMYAEDFEWGWSQEFPGLAGVHHDTETPNPRLRAWLSPWERWAVEVEDYVESGDDVVVLLRYQGRGKGSGVEVDVEGAHVW
jgi:ketosteroid isomerase-like protein